MPRRELMFNRALSKRSGSYVKMVGHPCKPSFTWPWSCRTTVLIKHVKLFRFMNNHSWQAAAAAPTRQSAQQQVDDYLGEEALDDRTDPLQYWKQNHGMYPQLAAISCRVLPIPTSSAPVECIFSIAGKFFRTDQCSLTDSRFEQLMLIRCSKDIWLICLSCNHR